MRLEMSVNRFKIAMRALEILFGALFLIQIYVSYMLRQQLEALKGQLQREHAASLAITFRIGDRFLPLPVRTLDGKQLLLDPSSVRMNILLLAIDPACPDCRMAIGDMHEKRFRHRGLIVISTADKGLTELAKSNGIAPFTYVLDSSLLDNRTKLKFTQTPITLLLSPGGGITEICRRPIDCRG